MIDNSEHADLPKIEIDWEAIDYNVYRMTITGVDIVDMRAFLHHIMSPQYEAEAAFPDRNIVLTSPPVGRSPSSDLLLTELKQRLQGKDFRDPNQ